jgi:hypothetical protein
VAWPPPNRDSHSTARNMLRARAVANTGLEQRASAARKTEEGARRCGKRLVTGLRNPPRATSGLPVGGLQVRVDGGSKPMMPHL